MTQSARPNGHKKLHRDN